MTVDTNSSNSVIGLWNVSLDCASFCRGRYLGMVAGLIRYRDYVGTEVRVIIVQREEKRGDAEEVKEVSQLKKL